MFMPNIQENTTHEPCELRAQNDIPPWKTGVFIDQSSILACPYVASALFLVDIQHPENISFLFRQLQIACFSDKFRIKLMEINVAVAAFEAFAFFLVEKRRNTAKHIFRFHVVLNATFESIKNLTQKEHKSKTLFRMCMIFLKITCLQVIS